MMKKELKKELEKKHKNDVNYSWIIKIILLAFIISIVFSFISETAIPNVNLFFGIILTLFFIFIGIVFSAYLVYMIWYLIKIIKINIAYKKGREDYALDFVVYPYRRYKSDMYVRIKFKYIDENGVQRTTKYIVQDAEYEILKTLVRLPIKVYKKSASVDYKRLSNF